MSGERERDKMRREWREGESEFAGSDAETALRRGS